MEEQSNVEKETLNVSVPIGTVTAQTPAIRNRARGVQQGLERKEVSFKIPTNKDAAVHVHKKHGQHSWQAKILKVIHAKWFQRLMIGLLLLDILILFTELFLLSMVSSVLWSSELVLASTVSHFLSCAPTVSYVLYRCSRCAFMLPS